MTTTSKSSVILHSSILTLIKACHVARFIHSSLGTPTACWHQGWYRYKYNNTREL